MTTLLATLTDEQRLAIESDLETTVLSAGPGAGKTRCIAARVAWLIEDRGVAADEILVLTFTRAACAEIRARLLDVGPVADEVTIETFHAAALRFGPPVGGLTVASSIEADAALRSLYEGPMRRPRRELPGIETLRATLMRWEARGGDLENLEDRPVRLVRQRLLDAGLIPTWDLVPRCVEAWDLARTFDHVLVDEGMDCTTAEAQMAELLRSPSGWLWVVMDPRQAIMGWRGADPDAWGMPTHWLRQTFRFGQRIAHEANQLEVGPTIRGREAFGSEVWLDALNHWATILEFDDYKSCAILTRTHADAEGVERLLPGIARHVRRRDDLALDEDADRIAEVEREGLIPVCTVHGAKGREWDQAVVVGPSTIRWGRASDEAEERRVLFVAMTRARRRLVLASGIVDSVPGWRARFDGVSG